MAVVSMIEGLRTLKYQDIENGILEPFFKKKEGVSTDEIGNYKLIGDIEDWTRFGFESEAAYKKALRRPKRTGGGSGGDCTYSGTATTSVGGIKTGKYFDDADMQEMWDALLRPTVAPTAKLTVTPVLCEKGKEAEITVTIAGIKGSTPITKYEYSYGSKTSSKTTAFTEKVIINDTTVFNGKVYSDDGNGTTSVTVRFCDRSYYGVISKDLIAASISDPSSLVTEEMIKNLQNSKLIGESTFKYSGITMKNERVCYCYPSEFGILSSIIVEGTPFNAIDSFILKKIKVNNVDMNCYIMKSTNSLTSGSISFSK